jgi:hypothetical protein
VIFAGERAGLQARAERILVAPQPGCRDSLGLEKGEATPITQLTTRKFIAVRLVRVGAWAMGSCAIVAVEENDRVVMLKVPEKVGRREYAGRNPERRRQPTRRH